MKILLILFSIVCACSCLDFNCLKGASYWCVSKENAIKCDRVVECGLTKKLDIPIACELCKEAIAKIESYIPDFDDSKIIAFLDKEICSHTGEFENECKKIIITFESVIKALIKQGENPSFICHEIQLCSSVTKQNLKNHILKIYPMFKSNSTCEVCKKVLSFLESLFNQINPNEIADLLKNAVCKTLPSELKDTCNQLVDQFSGQILELINSLLDGDRTCKALHLCSQIKATAAWECPSCVDVVTVLKRDLAGVSAAEVESMAEQTVCSKLGFFGSICKDKVEEYVGPFINDLNSALTPQQICQKNKLCPATNIGLMKMLNINIPKNVKNNLECEVCEKAADKLKHYILSPNHINELRVFFKTKVCSMLGKYQALCVNAVDNYLITIINIINSQLTDKEICDILGLCDASKVINKLSKLHSIECDACKDVLTDLKKNLANPTVQKRISTFIKSKICSRMGAEATKCNQTIDEFFTIVINTIIAEIDANKICKAIDFCSVIIHRIPLKSKNTMECDVCESVVKEAVHTFTTDDVEKKVDLFLRNNLCVHLGFIKSECKEFTDKYLPYLFRIARQSLNPELLCSELHLCKVPSFQKALDFLKRKSVKGNYECELCQFAINETRELLSNPDLQTSIENFLKNEVCSHFGLNKQKCEQDINEYYSLVINMLVEMLQPSICSDIGLCPASVKVNFEHLSVQTVKNCDLCSRFYKYIKHMKPSNSPVTNLIGLVHICSNLPVNQKQKCINLLKQLPEMDHAMKKSQNQQEFCLEMNMCPSKVVTNIGKNPCSWGPVFWCKSRDHAKLCGAGAIKHCVMVWSKNKQVHLQSNFIVL